MPRAQRARSTLHYTKPSLALGWRHAAGTGPTHPVALVASRGLGAWGLGMGISQGRRLAAVLYPGHASGSRIKYILCLRSIVE
jgi:hypothetical protein